MTILLSIAAGILYCIINGEIDAYKFRHQRETNHKLNGVFYCIFIVVASFYVGWLSFLYLLPLRALVFDQYLNVRRFGWKFFTYQPENPNSWWDDKENYIFGHDLAWYGSNAFYLLIFIDALLMVA